MPANPTALVIGASRGIGRTICLTFAKAGYNIGVSSRTTEDTAKLPGTIYTTAREVSALGMRAMPIECNVRNIEDINNTVEACTSQFGSLDVVIYNAGAILWNKIIDTPMKKFDLLLDVNVRGAYALTQAVLPSFLEKQHGKIILVSPPIYSRFFKGKTAYAISKIGMSVLVHGLSTELSGTGTVYTGCIQVHCHTICSLCLSYSPPVENYAIWCIYWIPVLSE